MKTDKDKGHNTRIIHKHKAMSYGLIVKANDDVPAHSGRKTKIGGQKSLF